MTRRSTRQLTETGGSATSIGDPLEFIRQEHDRQYEICDRLEDLPNTLDRGLDLDWVASICDFLSIDLPRHVEDEEVDLFPTLARRSRDHEGVELMLSQLQAEHELDLGLVEPVLSEMRAILATGAPRNRERFLTNLRTFAETQRRHLLWENRVVLPLAERHLTVADRSALTARLAARRGQARSA